MDKRTLLAVVLSVVVISIGFMIQGIFFAPDDPVPVDQPTGTEQGDGLAETSGSGEGTVDETSSETGGEKIITSGQEQSQRRTQVIPVEEEGLRERTIEIETDVMFVTLSTRGGDIKSLKLKEHLDKDKLVDMIFSGDSGYDAFFIAFGDVGAQPVDALFHYSLKGQYGVEFRRDFKAPPTENNETAIFTLIKKYTFSPDGYLFELAVTIENSIREYPNLDFNSYAYTLGFGPQIGPEFETLGGRGEFRYYYTYEEGKRKNNKLSRTGEFVVNSRFTWAGIVGKYFTILGVPDATPYTLTFTSPVVDGIPASSFMYFSRPLIKSSKNTDVYRFYMGPKTKKDMGRYNDAANNVFSLADLNLDSAIESSALLGWLEAILKFFLDIFYRIIPNYGVSIILLTIMIKVLFYPLTRKSFESTSKMQELNPKITEIREKYKDNSARMNQEMAALYKKEKVNPLGGCLPLLLQMPIFIGLYQVLSKHFALRGAPFFWWITDLSEPDSIWNFAPFELPLLRWTDLRLLPILFIVTQLLSSKLMQSPSATSTKNMKLMTYLMPIFFFFILYNAPSGLLLYWTLTNVLTSAQQKLVSVYKKSHDSNKPKGESWLRQFLKKYLGK